MSMVCPQCNGFFEQRLSCPACGVRLCYQSARGALPVGGRWRQSTIGQVALGLLLSQGLYYGLCRLFTSFELAFKEQLSLTDTSATVYVLRQVLQLSALLVGGMLAGAGQPTGAALGAVVGIFNGLLCVVLQPAPGQGVTTIALYSAPTLHAVFGTLAGWFGQLIWKPLPSLYPGQASKLVRKLGTARRHLSVFAGQVMWIRVAIGATIAILGTLSATLILEAATAAAARGSYGYYSEVLENQDIVLTWEIKALSVILGGALAGFNTRNGLKQGFFVGMFTLFALFLFLGVKGNATPMILVGTIISSMCLSLAGGWFGSQLLPPLGYKRPRGMGPATAV
jgi:hypothetical protein